MTPNNGDAAIEPGKRHVRRERIVNDLLDRAVLVLKIMGFLAFIAFGLGGLIAALMAISEVVAGYASLMHLFWLGIYLPIAFVGLFGAFSFAESSL